jgi:hypothetical protein
MNQVPPDLFDEDPVFDEEESDHEEPDDLDPKLFFMSEKDENDDDDDDDVENSYSDKNDEDFTLPTTAM